MLKTLLSMTVGIVTNVKIAVNFKKLRKTFIIKDFLTKLNIFLVGK